MCVNNLPRVVTRKWNDKQATDLGLYTATSRTTIQYFLNRGNHRPMSLTAQYETSIQVVRITWLIIIVYLC